MPEPPPLSPSYKDRKTGLIVFGILQILLGAFFALALLAIIAGHLIAAHRPETAAQTDPRAVLPSIAMMVFFMIACVWLGVGAINTRRWARAINLCISAMGLIFGMFTVVSLFWTLPGVDAMLSHNAQQTGQQLPATAVTFVKAAMIGTTVLFYIVIPGAAFLFYRSEHVRLTCEARDPVVRWTDRCPVPVLAIVLLQCAGVGSMLLFTPVYGWVFPFFGLLLQGPAAMILYLGAAVFMLATAWGFYRLRLTALWAYIAVILIFDASGVVTFSGGKLMLYYRAIGLPEAQLQQLNQMPMLHSSAIVWLGAFGALLYLGYLLWLKKYFIEQGSAESSSIIR
ncbi:MAG TPA: hypothetical protein VFT72_08190 [Opitutaceae bacterium]|nr:hypothetical protein [Opitutaceae bacterium]